METFTPGDCVVAINTDMSGPICGPANPELHPFLFPNGPLRKDVIYHVASVSVSKDGNQGLYLNGMRVFWGPQEFPWNSSRFRKVDSLKDHVPKKRRRKNPASAIPSAVSISLNL
jgi:hypothetical protein